MATYTSYDLVEFGKPLEAREREIPVPQGTECLIRVRRAGVCHSDLHIQDGYFDLGEEGKLEMGARGMKLPQALGHEILGECVAAGPDAPDAPIGKTMLVHPWIGCMKPDCVHCMNDRESDCPSMRALGVVRDGGRLFFDFPNGRAEVATRKEEDGSVSFVTFEPAFLRGVPILMRDDGTLVLADAQHEYVYTPVE